MTSSNGNIFRVTGHLCGEFTGQRWIPHTRPVTRSFDVFFHLRLNKQLSKQSWGWWFETLSRPLWRHCNVDIICVQNAVGNTTRHRVWVSLWRNCSLENGSPSRGKVNGSVSDNKWLGNIQVLCKLVPRPAKLHNVQCIFQLSRNKRHRQIHALDRCRFG